MNRDPGSASPDTDTPHVEITATAVAPWGDIKHAYAGSVPAWAWADPDYRRIWKLTARKTVLDTWTTDPRGWRVTFNPKKNEDTP